MTPETQQPESPYCVRIETETGQSSTVPIAVSTPKQLEVLLQSEFKRLVQEAGEGCSHSCGAGNSRRLRAVPP